jgi:large subunit ribosomal protein L27
MAHKKGGGSSRNGRDSQSQRLLLKCIWPVCSLGSIWYASVARMNRRNVDVGKDDTLFATTDGIVMYETIRDDRKRVNVVPESEATA